MADRNAFDEFDLLPEQGSGAFDEFDLLPEPPRAAPAGGLYYPPAVDAAPSYDAMGVATGYDAPAPDAPAMSYTQQMGNVLGYAGRALDNGARLLANGLTFGTADKAAGAADALVGNAESYDAGVRAQRDRTQALRDANPYLSGAVEAGGGILSAAGALRNGLTVAGRVGSGLVPRIVGYGAEGGAYGAAYGAGSTYSDNLGDYISNAWDGGRTGALIGGALPVAGTLASGLYRGAQALFSPSVSEGLGRSANTYLRAAAQADEAGIRALPSMGDQAMLVDAGPSMLGLGQGAGTGIGEGRTKLVNALMERDARTGQRLASSLEENLGPAPVPSAVDASIRQSQRALSPAYQEAFDGARRVDTRSIADDLESSIVNERGSAQQAARDVRDMLNINGTTELDPDPRTLFAVRNDIDARSRTADSSAQRILTQARTKINDMLADAVPGIRDADARYAELVRQREALERGQTVFDNGRGAVIRPAELEAELASGALPQGTAIGPSAVPLRTREGARAEIDRLVGTNVNDLNVLERTLATPQDWNFQKMGMVFGRGPRDAIAAELIANRNFRNTYQGIVQGSQSAQRLAASKMLDGVNYIPADMTVTGGTARAVATVARMLMNRSAQSTKNELGELLAKSGPERRRIAAALLEGAQRTREGASAISGVVSNPAYLGGASPAYGRR